MNSLSREEEDKLESLTERIKEYEEAHCSIPRVANRAILKHLLYTKEITTRQLASATNVRHSVILGFLAGKVAVSAKDAAKIARYFRLRPDVFEPEEVIVFPLEPRVYRYANEFVTGSTGATYSSSALLPFQSRLFGRQFAAAYE